MRISLSAVAVVTLWPRARGQREDEPRRIRGAAENSLRREGHAAPAAASARSANDDVELLLVHKALAAAAKDSGFDPDGEPPSLRSRRGKAAKSRGKAASSTSPPSPDDPGEPTVASPLSNPYKYESSKWDARKIKANVSLDVDAFDQAVAAWSESLYGDYGGVGITATLFDNKSEMVYQDTKGTLYTPLVDGGYSTGSGHGPLEEGWTGDTVFTPYSNTKGVAAATFLSSVVDTGLGFLDEPISTTFLDLKGSSVGKITPRMIMSHTSGLKEFSRETWETDPYYSCKYDESKSLRECLETFVLTDDQLNDPPGTMTSYNNEAFDVLAVLAPEKTGMENFGEIFQKYIAGPLGMDSTTYDCPVVKSTQAKPGVAWGLCSTGNDFPKFVQMLANNGMSPSGEAVLSKDSVYQMFSPGGGSARNTGDLLFDGPSVCMTRCYTRLVKGILKDIPGIPPELADGLADVVWPVTSVSGYGLGTMFFLGNYGEMFGHAGSTGGAWLVAPGRFSAYFTWMVSGVVVPGFDGYLPIATILDTFENASTFTVENTLAEDDAPQNIGVCGDMYIDGLALGGNGTLVAPLHFSDAEQSFPATEMHPVWAALNHAGNPAFNLL